MEALNYYAYLRFLHYYSGRNIAGLQSSINHVMLDLLKINYAQETL
jgi:hypothetical protein